MFRYRLAKFTTEGIARLVLATGYYAFGTPFVASAMVWLPQSLFIRVLRRHGASIGGNLIHKDAWLIDNVGADLSNLVIGNNCYVGKAVFFDLPNRIVLEDEVVVSGRVTFLTHADTGSRVMSRWYPRLEGPIRVGRGTWIGAGATILPGVELGECCVVGASAVVRESWAAGSVVAGVPARLVRTLSLADAAGDSQDN